MNHPDIRINFFEKKWLRYEQNLEVKSIQNQANDLWWFDNFQGLLNTIFLWSLKIICRWYRLWQCARIIASWHWKLRKLQFLEVRQQLLEIRSKSRKWPLKYSDFDDISYIIGSWLVKRNWRWRQGKSYVRRTTRKYITMKK